MAEMLQFELVSPERRIASTEAEAVTVPGQEGDLTAMANHAPFLTSLRPGYVSVTGAREPGRYFVTGGFAEIADNTVSILAEEALEADRVTDEWLAEKLEEAKTALEEAGAERAQLARQRVNDYLFVTGQA